MIFHIFQFQVAGGRVGRNENRRQDDKSLSEI